jgi:hypothetical protein
MHRYDTEKLPIGVHLRSEKLSIAKHQHLEPHFNILINDSVDAHFLDPNMD